MALPSLEEKKSCYRAFRAATSNAALAVAICIICAQELEHEEGEEHIMADIPHIQELLSPRMQHRAHELWDGMLVVGELIYNDGNHWIGWICNECYRALVREKLPKFSLANNMWIGPIPYELRILTIPEHLLIARHYPRCYIFKLYPKNADHDFHPEHLQRGIIGNVTLFETKTSAVVDMLEGKLMPQRSAVLASVLAITFVGTKKLPKNWLKSTFRVRRWAVYAALVWLQTNNPWYSDVEISEDRLAMLPEDGVPHEILATVRHEKNGDFAMKERASYVPDPFEENHTAEKGLELDGELGKILITV
jgi:hypothetical protein